MTKRTRRTYVVGVIERAISYYEVEAKDARAAAENWKSGEFWDRDDVPLDAEGPCNVREGQPDGTFLKLPESQWKTSLPAEAVLPTSVTLGLSTRFDDYEVHGVRRFDADPSRMEQPLSRIASYYEQVEDVEADFWSLFGHIPGQGLDCIGDFATREHAEEIYARITGRSYGNNGNRNWDR